MRYLIVLLLLNSCSFFLSRKGVPSAKGRQYSIRYKSPEWADKSSDRSDYVFESKSGGHILLSNSFCGEFQEEPLENLASKTFQAVKNFKLIKNEYTTFNNREAYRMEGSGDVDGVDVTLRMLNTRRNNCYFDFVSINPSKNARPQDNSFENFLGSVEFK